MKIIKIILAALLLTATVQAQQFSGSIWSPTPTASLLGETSVAMTNATCTMLTSTNCTLTGTAQASALPWLVTQKFTGSLSSGQTVIEASAPGSAYTIINTAGQTLTYTSGSGATVAVTNGSPPVTISTPDGVNYYAPEAGAIANALTGAASGGATPGTTFDGSVARIFDYHTFGASPLAGSTSLTTAGTISTGTWAATAIGAQYGGTGLNTSASTGCPSITTGTWSVGTCFAGTVTTSGSPLSSYMTYFTAPTVVTGTANATLDGSGDVTFGGSFSATGGNVTVSTGNPFIYNISGGVAPTPPSGTTIYASSNGGTNRITSAAAGATPYFTTAAYGGTYTSPTAVTGNTEIGGYNAWAYDGTAIGGPAAAFRAYAAQNWSVGSHGAKLNLATTPNGSTTETTILTGDQDGGIYTPNQADEGAGSINATKCYQSGTQCATVAALSVVSPWSATTAYVANQIVSANGCTYFALTGSTNQAPPSCTPGTANTYWDVLATAPSYAAILALTSPSQFGAPFYIFSDSQMTGTGANAPINSMQGILNASHGGAFLNKAHGGNQASDVAVTEAQNIPYGTAAVQPGAPLPVVLNEIGLNDYNGCGFTSQCLDIYNRAQAFSLTWAGMTAAQANRVLPAGMTLAGGFAVNSVNYAVPVALSTTNGSTATASVVTTGNPIGVDYVITNANTGQISCTVNGGSATVINEYPISPAIIGTNNPYTLFRTELAVSGAGTDTVVCTAANNTGTGNFAAIVGYDSVPVGVTGTLPLQMLATAPGISGSQTTGATTFNAAMVTLYNTYIAEGLNVGYFDYNVISNSLGANGYSGSYAPCPQNGAGGLHFNNCIHLTEALGYIAAFPNTFRYNWSNNTGGPPQSYGGQTVPNFSYLENNNTGAAFSATAINPGGYLVYPGQGMFLGAFTGGAGEFQSVGAPYLGFNSFSTCWTVNTPSSAATYTLQSQFGTPGLCYTPGGLYGWTGANTGGVPTATAISVWHPWVMSHDNIVNITASGGISINTDFAEIGTLTGNISLALPVCKNLGISYSKNPQFWVRRIGTDGFSITFTTSGGDNINGASTYVWSASEPDAALVRCSGSDVSGEYWGITPYTIQPTATTSMNATTQLTTAGGEIGMGTFSNLVAHSSQLTDATWVQQSNPLFQYTVTAAQADPGFAPGNGLTAVKLVTGSTAGNFADYQNTVGTPAVTTYCTSVWVKGGAGGETNFFVQTGNQNFAITGITTSWKFYEHTLTTTNTSGTMFDFKNISFPASPETAYIAYPSVILGPCPSTVVYIPTTSAQITSYIGVVTPSMLTNTISVGVSQGMTGVQGSTGTKFSATTGSFTPGNLRSTNSTGDEIDSSVVAPVSNPVTSATGGSGTGTVTCVTANCTNLRGTFSVTGGTFTTGNFLALVWPTTTTAYVCTATMNGGTGFLGIGNDVATATGMNISAGVSILGLTVTVNYSCKP